MTVLDSRTPSGSPEEALDPVEELDIDGAWVYTPRIHADGRGSFLEWFQGGVFHSRAGYRLPVAQANCSVSRRGVIRGIHFADVPPGQAKYVTCVSGTVIDVVVDLRAGSPSFGRWAAVQLDDRARRAVFIGEGLGHAFAARSEEATVMYLCSSPYQPGREHGIHPLDPALAIAWPGDVEPILSDKDARAPSLARARAAGLLPDYAACLAHAARRHGS
ncbi:MAG: dTDP-4-dehydrorhamnose 3,5-epimerase [Streptosporangiaceae bacterium]